MTVFPTRRWTNIGKAAGGLAAVALLAAGCGGASSSKTASGVPGSSSGGASTVTVETHSGPLGTYLTDGSGMSLYMFASDSADKSTCTGSCVTYWPPLTTTGKTSTSGNATGGKLATLTRSDGSKQVTYDGHPLYYFALDKSPGDTLGQGSDNFGAKWWLLTPGGAAITRMPAGSTSSPASPYSNGGGY